MTRLADLMVELDLDPEAFGAGVASAEQKLKRMGQTFRKIGIGLHEIDPALLRALSECFTENPEDQPVE